MSMSGDEATDDLFQHLVAAYQRVRQVMHQGRRVTQGLLNRFQRRRVSLEDSVSRGRWDPETDRLMRRSDGPERTRDMERVAELAEQNDALERQNRELEERNAELDQALNDDRDRNGRDDRVEDRTDRDRDGRDDATERRDEIDERNDDANDRDGDGQDDAVERRQEERERADEERRRRDEQNRQGERDGIDPATATGAAAGAAVAAEALDDERDERAQPEQAEDAAETEQAEQAEPGEPGQTGQQVEETGERAEPAGEADNQLQAENEQPSPYVTDEADVAQDRAADAQEPALDAQDANALDDPAAESPSPYATDNPRFEQVAESREPALDSDVDSELDGERGGDELDAAELGTDDRQPALEADDGVNPYVANEERGTDTLAQDGVDPYVSDHAPGDLEQSGTDLNGTDPAQDVQAQDVQAQTVQAPDGQGPQSQWRPPERAAEDPVLDEARANKPTQQTGAGRDIPADEKAVLVDKTQKGHAPAHEAVSSSPAVGGGERTGRELQQANERTDRTRGNDGPGLSRT
ncbi:hypothetical protein [Kribbella sp. HUAS MG21]|uniref:Uncharacterized protein n=1 Tax=Kribbella sp. HUAS MG21 TaxID=3160966 RepID=A0AAU7TI15_9ACTN